MSPTHNKQKKKEFLLVILFLQITTYVLILFNIPVARQLVGFIYFSFIPGLIIIKLLKINKLDMLESILFSVGLSIAFLMLIGLSINELYPILGITRPLSLTSLLLTINTFILILSILAYLRDENVKFPVAKNSKPYSFIILVLLFILPILSIVGAIWVNAYGNNVILLMVIILIAFLFTITAISKSLSLQKLYPIVIFVIAISLLYQGKLISNYPITYNSDLARELFISENTLNNAYWNASNSYGDVRYGRVHSMLSVTILPTIYSNLLNLELAWIFKIIYPTIFSLVPLGLYILWRGKLGSKAAFVSVFLLLSNAAFYSELLGLNRQMIAELFFVLLLFIVLNNKIKSSNRMICFIIISVALVTSHYAIAEIFMFIISLSLILLIAAKKPSRKITLSMVVLFFVIMFSWYIYTARSSAFESFVSYGNYVYDSLGDIFNPEAREPEVLRGLGLEAPPTMWNAMSRGFAYIVEFLIVIGFVGLVTKKVQMKISLDKEFFMFILVAIAFLVLLILVPGLSLTMNMSRFFHILLFLIAPLSIIGADFLISLFKRSNRLWVSVLLIVILVPYFLFQTGFVYEIVGNESWSLPLSVYRMPAYRSRGFLGYVDERDVSSAYWLQTNVNTQSITIHADIPSVSYVLFAYGMIPKEKMIVLSNITIITDNSVIYLSRLNTVDSTIMGLNYIWNSTDFPFPDYTSKIYTNGASEIYEK